MKKLVEDYIIMTLGLVFVALGINFFLVPHNLASGGLSGLAIVINYYFPGISVGIIMLLGNIFFFIIGFIFIGKSFGVKTIYSSLMLSGIITFFEWILPVTNPLTDDIFISLVFGTLFSALGMAIVFNRNASTGGTDIPAKIVNKYLHVDIGKALLLIDFFVTLLAAIAFGATTGLYSILGVIITGYTVDFIIDGFNITKRIEIISNKPDEVKIFILRELKRSATLYKGVGAYDSKELDVIVTVLGKKEFVRLKNFIKEVDSDAFIITHNVHEVLGKGFGDIYD